MKITECIEKLETIKKTCGDVHVFVIDDRPNQLERKEIQSIGPGTIVGKDHFAVISLRLIYTHQLTGSPTDLSLDMQEKITQNIQHVGNLKGEAIPFDAHDLTEDEIKLCHESTGPKPPPTP